MRFAKKIIAISESTKREVLSYYPWAKGKVEVTYPGYDKSKFHVPNNKSQITNNSQIINNAQLRLLDKKNIYNKKKLA